MKITRHVEHRINTGDYSSVTIGATVELDSNEYDDISAEDLIGEAQQLLDGALDEDLSEARRTTSPSTSHVHDWKT